MTVLKSVGVISVGKALGCLYALLGLIGGALISLASLVGVAGGGGGNMLLGVGAVVLLPLFYGIGGFIGGLIIGATYNLVAAQVGGIEFELTEKSSYGKKYGNSNDDY